ncbi:hypothetical protein Q5P01_001121 [Channa striata]|uniref:Immunoglobulin V-set domain-containing protein n=1 Tax=Channa striata TaxID=64152 RepID=A0AA88T4Y6_CHASR|nr:hypothetical protein Q5P01_001121 [Channa striata]
MKMNNMKSCLLLVLSLLTGCEASSNVKGCRDGWAEFTCKCQKSQRKCEQTKKSAAKDTWENKGTMFLYPDTKRMVTQQLEQNNFGENKCKSEAEPSTRAKKQQLKVEVGGCQEPFTHTAYKKTRTNIMCNKSENEQRIAFFCKEENDKCEDVLPPKSNGRFTVTDGSSNISIGEVSSKDAGVYWCGVKAAKENNITLRKIQLDVKDIIHFSRSPPIGKDFIYWCNYPQTPKYAKKFICKGEDPSMCQTVVTTQSRNERFSMKEDKGKTNITITLMKVTAEDSGTYWCGAEDADSTSSPTFFHRFVMTVGPRSITPVPSTAPTASAASHGNSLKTVGGGSSSVVIGIICVTLLMLLFVLISILLYKRFSCSKNPRNETAAAAKQNSEDYIYEEIQEPLQNPDSDNALVTTIYATASFPPDPSASLRYMAIDFKMRSDKAGDETPVLRPSSTRCEYSTVKDRHSPTLNHPSRSAEEPLYSTVKHPEYLARQEITFSA